ncbi:MAG: hypothetical protein Q8P67_11460 [archaeon]|nr:hypothetical protein [archaeon]
MSQGPSDSPILRQFYGEIEERLGALQARQCSPQLRAWAAELKRVGVDKLSSEGAEESEGQKLREAEEGVLQCLGGTQEEWRERVHGCTRADEARERMQGRCMGFPFPEVAAHPDQFRRARLPYTLQRSIHLLQSDRALSAECALELADFWECVCRLPLSSLPASEQARWRLWMRTRRLSENVSRFQRFNP